MTASRSSASNGPKREAAKSPRIKSKARAILAFAVERSRTAKDWVELHNALFGIGGKANELLSTPATRTAFCKTKESQQVYALLDKLPAPPAKPFDDFSVTANGAISVRLPRSVH